MSRFLPIVSHGYHMNSGGWVTISPHCAGGSGGMTPLVSVEMNMTTLLNIHNGELGKLVMYFGGLHISSGCKHFLILPNVSVQKGGVEHRCGNIALERMCGCF